jgi:nucleoside-diphosphate-sugar epimerase
MSILVTGATGTIGSLIVQRLADAGALDRFIQLDLRSRSRLNLQVTATYEMAWREYACP